MKKYNTNYYGSPLNLFIAENCKKDMVVNNIDLIIHDYNNKILTIIESKHDNEPLRVGQRLLLKKLQSFLPVSDSGYKIQMLVVRGNYPYLTAILEDFDGNKINELNQQELIKFIKNE